MNFIGPLQFRQLTDSYNTFEFRGLGQCFIDWATAVVGEADRELTSVTLTYHSSGPIYETSAQSMKSHGNSKSWIL